MITSEVNLEHAYTLASTLMWKRFGDEKPIMINKPMLLRLPKHDLIVTLDVGGRWYCKEYGYIITTPGDLWLYLSDLDVLRVKE